MILDRKPKHHIKYMYFYIILILETFFTSIFHVYFAWNQIASYYLFNIPITGGFRSHGDTLIQVIRPWKLSMPLVGSSEHRWEQFMGEPLTQMLRVWYIYVYIWAGTPTPPPTQPDGSPPLWQGRGGFLSSQAMVYVVFIVHIVHMYR